MDDQKCWFLLFRARLVHETCGLFADRGSSMAEVRGKNRSSQTKEERHRDEIEETFKRFNFESTVGTLLVAERPPNSRPRVHTSEVLEFQLK